MSAAAFDGRAGVMTGEPYASARRVFWVVDNGTIYRGQAEIDRLQGAGETGARPPTQGGGGGGREKHPGTIS